MKIFSGGILSLLLCVSDISVVSEEVKPALLFEDNFDASLKPEKWQWSQENVSVAEGKLLINSGGRVLSRLVYPEGELEARMAFTQKRNYGTLCWGWRVNVGTKPRITFSAEGSSNLTAKLLDDTGLSFSGVEIPLDSNWHDYKIKWEKQSIRFFIDGKNVCTKEIPDGWKFSPRPICIYNLGSNGTLKVDWIKYKSSVKEAEFSKLQNSIKFNEYRNNPPDIMMKYESDRTAFYRMEEKQSADISITNIGKEKTFSNCKATISIAGYFPIETMLPEMSPGTACKLSYPLNLSLRSGKYNLIIRITDVTNAALIYEETLSLTIVPRLLPFRMPVVLWDTTISERERNVLKDLGFTHYIFPRLVDYERIFNDGKTEDALNPKTLSLKKKELDTFFAEGWNLMGYLYPGRWIRQIKPQYYRIDRKGKAYDVPKKDICPMFQDVRSFVYNVGASVALSFEKFPALNLFDFHSECRDYACPSFFQIEKDAFRKYSGFDIPDEVEKKNGVSYKNIKGFPANRVVSDKNPILTYYRWYYQEGDGWNQLNNDLMKGLESTGRKDWNVFFGPSTRVPSLWGSGGNLDAILNWAYVYPDPLSVGMCVDQQFSMAKSKAVPQKVFNGIQIICYRSILAPANKSVVNSSNPATWDDADPHAAYITVPPMLFREAFWTEIARPLDGLVFHGMQSLIKADVETCYKLTNTQTQNEFRRIMHEVVMPFGPMLRQVPDIQTDVAFLESFTSQMFAGRGNYGWNGACEGIAYLVTLHAQLQPEIIYEESIQRDGLDRYKILIMPCCDVLTESLVAKVNAFQKRGGIIVADPFLCPAVRADITIPFFSRWMDPKRKNNEDKAKVLELAGELREKLNGRYARKLDSEDPEIVVRLRGAGTADYIFVVNDHREYGDYVGQFKVSMENGIPAKTRLSLKKASGVVYDLMEGRKVNSSRQNGTLSFDVELGPCEGKIFMVVPEPVTSVVIENPKELKLSKKLKMKVSVLDNKGEPVQAVLPIEVKIADPEGRASEIDGFYGAKGGVLEINLDIAPNDKCGMWWISVRELASGMTCRASVRVSQ